MERNERLGTIIKVIANHPGITLNQLCKELARAGVHVTERTIAKDIVLLKHEFGLLPQRERLRQGYVLENMCTVGKTEVPLVLDALHVFGFRLSDAEAVALINRMRRWFGGDDAVALRPTRTIRHRTIFKQGRQAKQIEQALFEAIRSQEAVSITYETPRLRKPQQATGYPLLMVFHERAWYCIIRDQQSNTYRPRRLDRIKSCAPAPRSVPANPHHLSDVTEAEYLISCGWGMTFPQSRKELEAALAAPPIVVRFDSSVAGYILESVDRHPFGKVSASQDGTASAQIEIRLANPREFVFWVRSFGAHARIVSPRSYIDAEVAELKRMLATYS